MHSKSKSKSISVFCTIEEISLDDLFNRRYRMEFLGFPSIEKFHNVVKAVGVYPVLAETGIVKYRGKVKIHGTNASVRVANGEGYAEFAAQSRTRIITPTDDNSGFAKWVETHKGFFAQLNDKD